MSFQETEFFFSSDILFHKNRNIMQRISTSFHQIYFHSNYFPPYEVWFCAIIFLINYFNWRLITLQYCSGFYHTLTLNSHGCTCIPHPESLSHHPPHPIPQGRISAAALSVLPHASNLDWRSVSQMVIYMFQWHSLKSSHPRLLPESKSLFFTPWSLLLSCI